uniref:Plus3 domain-containing protein n=1 Tax=Vitis vinifera TaxID=29760 RepID=F6HDZ1_VITVI
MGILKRGRKIMGLTCKFLWLKKNPELIVVCVGMFRIVLDSDNISGLPIEEIIQPKMNADNDNKEQLFDLGLALGYSSQCIGKALNNDSGAGANAGSRVDMTLVATDPLSELVWSPHKGLSLKCAENSTDEKRPSLLWGVGPSNMIHSPPQGISARKTISDEPMGEGNLVTSQATLHVKNEMGETDILTCSPRSNAGIMTVHGSSHEPNAGTRDNNDKMMVAVKVSALDVNQERDQGDNEEKGIYVPVHIPMDVTSEARGKKVSGFSGMELGCMADSLSFKMNETEPDMAQIEPLPMQLKKMISSNPNGGIGDDGSGNQTLGMEVVLTTEVPLVKRCKTPDTPVLNSTSPFRRDEGLALAIEEESNNEMKTPGSTSTPLEKLESAAENDLRTQTGENACGAVSKIMASSSDHDVKIISQQDEGLRPKAKALPVNNSPNKSGMYRHRTKGKGKALSDGDRSGRKSNKEDDSDESVESCNSAALFSTGKKRWGYEQQLITGSKRIRKQINGSPGSTSFVRQDSSFMSWISNMMKGLSKSNQDETPSLALTLARPNHDNYDQKLVTCNKNQDPGCRNIGFQSIFQSLYCPTTKVQESRTLNADNQTGEGSKEFCLANKLCDVNITPIACHGENKSFKNALLSNEKFNQSTFGNRAGPSTQPKVLSAKFAVSQENYKTSSTIHNFGYKSDLLGSLWVTRFSPKTSSPTCKVDHCNQNTGTREYCTEEPLTIVGAELQNCSGGTEVSFGFKKNNAHNNQNSIYKLNPISPSQRFKSSEAMASLFARRLDALKNIITLNQTDTEARATPTCFFCGIRECGASLVNRCSSGMMLHDTGDKRNGKLLGSKENPPQVAAAFGVCSGRKPTMQIGCSLNKKGNGNMTAVKLFSNSNLVQKYTASSSGEIESKESQIIPLCNFVNPQISDVPKGIFDAIKRLRLSRGDILKWMNSVFPFSHLNGFFLRLRLGKWEEGLGGTGYYVACISGAQKERPSQSSKNPIAVNIGGVKCLVQSQYISNHDFLEDELMAWWGATTRAGGKIPSEEDLKVKLEERKKFGF